MIQILKTVFHLETSMSVNAFLFYFKRLPFIGRIFSDQIYEQVSLKGALSVLVFILKTFRDLMFKTIYAGLVFYLPAALLYSGYPALDRLGALTHAFILITVLSPILFCDTFEPSKAKSIAIRILRIPSKKYYIYHIFYGTVRHTLLLCPSICVITLLAGGNLLHGLYFTLLTAAFRLLGHGLNILLFSRTGKIINGHLVLQLIFLSGILAAAYVPLIAHMATPARAVVFSLPFAAVSLASVLLAVLYILKASGYSEIFYASDKLNAPSVDRKTVARQAVFKEVTLKDTDLTASWNHKKSYENKHGYVYLNAIFFQRHRRMLLKPMYISLVCIGLMFLAALAALGFIPEFSGLYIKLLTTGFPSLVFVMYLLSLYLSQRATKAMFYNCDISLLRYSYYRKRSVILTNFKIRLKQVLLLNGLPGAALAAALLILALLASPKDLVMILPIILLVITLAIFFSVHHLFLYYVLQPFTTDLDVKNPLYKFINGLVYIVSYLCLQIRQAPGIFVIIILAVTVLYSITALILVMRLAPENFRVK